MKRVLITLKAVPPRKAPSDHELVTTKEAAAILGLSERAFRLERQDGTLVLTEHEVPGTQWAHFDTRELEEIATVRRAIASCLEEAGVSRRAVGRLGGD